MKTSLYNERKYLLLRKRLDELHYSLPLQIESAELVEKLLGDLVKTTEGFQKLLRANEELEGRIALHETSLNPLEHENRRLTRENQQLHLEIIASREHAAKKDSLAFIKLKSVEADIDDLKFALAQSEKRNRGTLEQNLSLKNKMDTIQAKVFLPSTEKGFDELPRTYINANAASPANLAICEEHQSDRLEEQQQQQQLRGQASEFDELLSSVRKLESEVRDLKSKDLTSREEIQLLKGQVANRDAEIKRLQTRIDVGGVSLQKLSNEYLAMQQNDKIKLLNNQITFLSKENNEMETTLRNQKTLGELGELNVKLQAQNTNLSENLNYQREQNYQIGKKLQVQYPNGRFTQSSAKNAARQSSSYMQVTQ